MNPSQWHFAMKGCLGLLCLLVPAGAGAQTGSAAPAACAKCHVEALTQPSTYMAHALETIEQARVLTEHPVLTTSVGKYSYRVERKGNQSEYSVSDGAQTLTLPIRWTMGASSALGQTFILEKDGELYESRVSWFRELNGLGPTLGSGGSAPADIVQAAGRLMSQSDKLRCFGCHATNVAHGRELTLNTLTPGVQCSHCHVGTEEHLVAMQQKPPPPVPLELRKLIGMSADQAANFCGQCHRTWAEIASQPNPGIANVRFQPYRLTSSKCFDPDDARISCLACHNPHHDFTEPKAVSFDRQCLSCHAGGKPGVRKASVAPKPGAKACPVAKENCVSCHMPRLDLPGAHYKFIDHRIRIVKPNEPYPG
jgi:hypothetical protein